MDTSQIQFLSLPPKALNTKLCLDHFPVLSVDFQRLRLKIHLMCSNKTLYKKSLKFEQNWHINKVMAIYSNNNGGHIGF